MKLSNGEETILVSNIGELRKAIETLPDDFELHSDFAKNVRLQICHSMKGEPRLYFDDGED